MRKVKKVTIGWTTPMKTLITLARTKSPKLVKSKLVYKNEKP